MPDHKTIHTALLEIQTKLTNPIKSATNPHFKSKYAALPEIRDLVTPILAEAGLYCLQPVLQDDRGAYLQTRIVYAATGEQVMSEMPLMLEKQTPQGMGSALTYARRYALCSLLNIAADEDDDGQAASKGKPTKTTENRLADDVTVQDDMRANGYNPKAVYDTVLDELNRCENMEMLSAWVKVNKETRRMNGLPSDLKNDVTTKYNKLKEYFLDNMEN